MHPEADAFLDAIFDHPDDDTPRLVYADWLEEHDQGSYAQFIRLQCAAAREKLWSDEANRLWEEIGRVWTKLDEEWWPATRHRWGIPGVRERWVSMERGWVSYPTLLSRRFDATDFHRGLLRTDAAAHALQALKYDDLWAWFPGSSLNLFPDFYDCGELLARFPLLRRVRHLSFEPGTAYELDLLFRSPHLSSLKQLDVSAVALSSSWVEALATSSHLSALEEVRIRVDDAADCDPETAALKLMDRFKKVVRVGA